MKKSKIIGGTKYRGTCKKCGKILKGSAIHRCIGKIDLPKYELSIIVANLPKIKPPKYKIGVRTFNEYEIRLIQAEIAEGRWPKLVGATVIDEKGNTSQFREDGVLTNSLYGFDWNSEFVLRVLFRAKKEKNDKNIKTSNSNA